MELKIGDEEIPSEKVGYTPDPLANPTESTTSDTAHSQKRYFFYSYIATQLSNSYSVATQLFSFLIDTQ